MSLQTRAVVAPQARGRHRRGAVRDAVHRQVLDRRRRRLGAARPRNRRRPAEQDVVQGLGDGNDDGRADRQQGLGDGGDDGRADRQQGLGDGGDDGRADRQQGLGDGGDDSDDDGHADRQQGLDDGDGDGRAD